MRVEVLDGTLMKGECGSVRSASVQHQHALQAATMCLFKRTLHPAQGEEEDGLALRGSLGRARREQQARGADELLTLARSPGDHYYANSTICYCYIFGNCIFALDQKSEYRKKQLPITN